MPRPEHKFLVVAMLLLMSVSPLWAFYDEDNTPAGQPPNYAPIDSSYFMGAPRFADYTPLQVGGYYIFKDVETGRWNVIGLVWPGGTLYEQVHGSVLVQMDLQPQEGVNVWPIGFHHSDNLYKNDRWGWVKWPEAIAPNLYEVWWDFTIDVARLGNSSDPFDSIGIAFTGCAFDFNIWATGHFGPFTAQQVKVGKDMTPITSIPGFVDTYDGLSDPYQGASAPRDPNISNFTLKDLPGATYGPDSMIPSDDTYGGARAYEGNGVEFSVSACPPPGDNPPVYEPPLGYAEDLTICLGSSITDTIRAIDPDQGDILTMEILSGPGTLTSVPGPSPLLGYFTWTPTSPGAYTIVYKVTDSQGLFAIDSVTYTITLNQPPVAQATDTTIATCELGGSICRTVTASDPENDPLTYTLLDGIGSIDPSTGEVCFTPEQPGDYGFLVAVADSCGADTVSFAITIEGNNPPHINPYDSVVVLCAADTICFDVTASDPDAGDSLAIVLLDGPGVFTQTGNGLGRQCFLPEDVDSARYVFRYGVTDDCLRQGWLTKTVPPMPTDSIIIIVITNRPPTIVCPGTQDMRLCAPEMVCYTFDAVNSGDDALTYTLLQGTGTIDPATGKLCFYAEASGQYRFVVAAANECGADTCTAVFNVTVDSPPVVSLPDTTVRLCQLEEICLPLTFSDPDDDIVSITVQSQKYVVADGEVCFVPDGPGVHEIIVTVTDSCGNSASDTSQVNVILNTAPQAAVPADTTVMQCTPAEVCLTGFGVFDADGNLASVMVLPNIGQLSDGTYCFMPDTSGYYCLVIQATDSCGAIAADTVCITVSRGASPAITCPEPQTAALCHADSICVPVEMTPADAVVTILEPGAVYRDGSVCFYAAENGSYHYTIVAANECGADTCAVDVDVTVGIPPVVSCPGTQTEHLCGP
ncbi:MAG: hypothetical protein PHR28_08635, partial [candidate division Zixibacteria bacterium]|nr:hypothetical protein [candidate division Zixibacteria bacterium]